MKFAILYTALLLSVSTGLQSQVLSVPPRLGEVIPPVTEQVERTTATLQRQKLLEQAALQQRLQQQLAVKAALPDPLTRLPAVLDIVDQQGQVRWTEVEVEQGFRAIEREWLLLLTAAEWQALVTRWPQISRYQQSQQTLAAFDRLLITLKVPEELDSAAKLQQAFNDDLAKLAGRNHLYQPQTDTTTKAISQSVLPAAQAMCQLPVALGMIDTAVAAQLPAFRPRPGQFSLVQQNFLPGELPQSFAHGTAVAGLWVGASPQVPALLPQLTLYSASAFYPSSDYLQSATLAHILSALDWLVSQQVKVINMSLTGPENPVLSAVMSQIATRDVIVVAAAGNGGPAAPPLYPAAYPTVIAVTAVDQAAQLYRWANQGSYIDYAAVGVKVPTLSPAGGVTVQSGTSMAAPVLSAAVACLRAAQPKLSLEQVRQYLTEQARDLGEPGKDPQFGFGLINAPLETVLQ